MKEIEPDEPDFPGEPATSRDQERLQRENQELRRQLEELKGAGHGGTEAGMPAKLWHPSALTIWSIFLAVIILFVVAFLSGYIPLQKRRAVIAGEAHEQERALPRVEVIEVGRASGKSDAPTARKYPGDHRGAHPGAGGWIRPAPHGGHRRPGPGRAACGGNRSSRDGGAGSSVEGQFAAGAGGGGTGAGQLQPGEVRHRTGSSDCAALDQSGRARAWFRDRRTTSIKANINRVSQVSSRSKRRSVSSAAMWLRRRRTWRGSRGCRPTWW